MDRWLINVPFDSDQPFDPIWVESEHHHSLPRWWQAHPAFAELTRMLTAAEPNAYAAVHGMETGASSPLLAALGAAVQRPALITVPSAQAAQTLVDGISTWLSHRPVLYFPSFEVLPHERTGHQTLTAVERLRTLSLLNQYRPSVDAPPVVVAPVKALTRWLVSPQVWSRVSIRLEPGRDVSIDQLRARLVAMGYERETMVSAPGQFSQRGGIVDVFPPAADQPVRLDFFGDKIESIRRFDVGSQRSIETLDRFEMAPAQEALLTAEARERAAEALSKDLHRGTRFAGTAESDAARARLRDRYGPVIDQLEAGGYPREAAHLMPYAYQERATLLDYFPAGTWIAELKPNRQLETWDTFESEREDREAELLAEGLLLSKQRDIYLSSDTWWGQVCEHSGLALMDLLTTPPHRKPDQVYEIQSRLVPQFQGQWSLLASSINTWLEQNRRIILLAANENRVEKLHDQLQQRNISHSFQKRRLDPEVENVPKGTVAVFLGELARGVEVPGADLVAVADTDLFETAKPKRITGVQTGARIKNYADLNPGDYVVHMHHGIGRYLGIKTMEVQGAKRDYLHLEYKGQDRLYVPTDKIDLVQKYIGADGKEPRLYSLNTKEWNRVKQRVKQSVREMAEELLELYAAREALDGYAFSPDTAWQAEFEDQFPFQETDDQLRAAAEIKADMEQPVPMDRLLCGDVGYGKTEVAMRACFKAVMDSKQVAVLVPTTVLAEQHSRTFRERFEPFPVKIGVLSRFQTKSEQAETITDLRRGDLDIVIGTHRLLQDDVDFHDLGLVVIDEEHRFGVKDKERLKALRQTVDVLTLTATPIPRTLHMSLVNLRDMSVLSKPPEGRYPVETQVVEYRDDLVRDAIVRELHRDGQVFYVHNRVQSIDYVQRKLSRLVPQAEIAVAHGQMPERQLEQVMLGYTEGQFDVLVCTTIIESGLDIARANTLIVEEADKMGLAQMYQIRGRVGRSHRVAYAYFTFKKQKALSEQAEKRLSAIRDFTEFGAGFQIALRDLEIRGAGNILGPEQHGFIVSVGFDLYSQLLQEAVHELKGEHPEPKLKPEIELGLSAFIPDGYIRDPGQKVRCYKQVQACETVDDVTSLREEWADRFGQLPEPVSLLLTRAEIRIHAAGKGIYRIDRRGHWLNLRFATLPSQLAEATVRLKGRLGQRMRIEENNEKPVIRLKLPRGDEQPASFLLEILEQLTPAPETAAASSS